MGAVRANLVIPQGSTWSKGWGVIYQDDPIDDTWTVRAQVRRKADSTELLHEFAASIEPGVDVDDNPVMAAVIGVDAATSSAWTWREAVYDVEITNADESVTLRVAEGTVSVSPEVTR